MTKRAFSAWLVPLLVTLFAVMWPGKARAQLRCEPTTGTDRTGTVQGTTTGDQTGRLQNGLTSTCDAPKTPPNVLSATHTFKYDSYTFKNRTLAEQCITATLTTTGGTAQSVAYLGSFDPAAIQTNYLGDTGANVTAATVAYSFKVPALANFVVTVNANSSAAPFAIYSLNVKDCGQIVVTSIDPSSGPVAGNTLVTIKGTGFLTGATATIGGSAATNVSVFGDDTISAKTPAGTAGPADVVVTNLDGTTSTLAGGFTYVATTGTGISLTSSANPAKVGESITFSATLKNGFGAAIPNETITFTDGATSLGTGTTNASGVATVNKVLAFGTHTIKAAFAGDASFSASESSVLSQDVQASATTTTLASSMNPSVPGTNVTFTATVAAAAPGGGTPTGAVTFTSDGMSIGMGTLDNTGKASVSTNMLTLGTHAIIATYGGAMNAYTTSASTTLTQSVTNVVVDAGADGGSTSSSSSGGMASSSSGGSTSSGGSSSGSAADAGPSAPAADNSDSGGCDCRQTDGSFSSAATLTLFAALMMFARGRRRRS